MDEAVDAVAEYIKQGGCHVISVANANKWWQAQRDPRLQTVLDQSAMIVPEYAIVWAARRLGKPLREFIAGIELFKRLLDEAQTHSWSVYLLGARPDVVAALAAKLSTLSPPVRIVGFHDGYFASPGNEAIAAEIRACEPDLLFVAMGSPRQEYWMGEYGRATCARVLLGVGGSFDVLAGWKPDTPACIRGTGWEWLYRLWLDPRNLWRRYLVTNTWFLWCVIAARLRQFAAADPRMSTS